MRSKDTRSTGIARRLRRTATEAEKRIWGGFRDRRLGGFKFVRQEPIGRFVVDFCCRQAKLVVEIDGSQHAGSARDEVRDAWLRGEGFEILRFWNNDAIARTANVLETILAALMERSAAVALAPDLAGGARESDEPRTQRAPRAMGEPDGG